MSLPLAKMTDNQLPFLIISLTVIVFFGIIALRKPKKRTINDLDISNLRVAYFPHKEVVAVKYANENTQYFQVGNSVALIINANIKIDNIPIEITVHYSTKSDSYVYVIADETGFKTGDVDFRMSE